MTTKDLIKSFIPPILLYAIRKMRKIDAVLWKGNYADWQSALNDSLGYDNDAILERVLVASRNVRDGEALYERDSVCFYHEEYNWPLLACLMRVAAIAGELHVLDFGGALGSAYMQHRNILSGLSELTWNVVEQPHFVEAGRREFQDTNLSFFDDIHSCFNARPINLVLFSSVLQYLEEPYDLLKETLLAGGGGVNIVIDRTPLSDEEDRITVQEVPSSIYKASYPCRFLSKDKLQSILEAGGSKLTPWFRSSVDPDGFWGVMSFKSIS